MARHVASGEFRDWMARLGPFERNPHIAVACSGGADSLALAILADEWVRALGGRTTALVVDHAMRPESAEEAVIVAGRLRALGIEAEILTRAGAAPASDRQAAARRARYALLRRWCEAAGVLHLLLAHHRQDQAETLLLRLARGSGVDGLGAMAPLVELAELRLLRPLLDVPRDRLVALLDARGQPYVDDPSNRNQEFARIRMRSLLPQLSDEGLTAARLAGTARRMGRARAALEQATVALLAEAVGIYPQGYAVLSPAPLLRAPEEIGLRALARILACIGGAEHVTRLERLERLYRWLGAGGGGRTLAGCRLLRRRGGILVCREAAAIEGGRAARPGLIWDRRFRIAASGGFADGVEIGALGGDGWRQIAATVPAVADLRLPMPVREALPALRDLDGIAAIPHLKYRRGPVGADLPAAVSMEFYPARSLGAAGFPYAAEFSRAASRGIL